MDQKQPHIGMLGARTQNQRQRARGTIAVQHTEPSEAIEQVALTDSIGARALQAIACHPLHTIKIRVIFAFNPHIAAPLLIKALQIFALCPKS